MPVEIDLAVFDMDGVLSHLDHARRLALLAELTGREAAFLDAAIWQSGFDRSAEQGAYPTGAEYLAELNRRAGSRLTRAQWARARREAMTPDAEALRIAQALRGQCELAMLTNNGSLLLECLPEILPEAHRLFGARAHASFQFQARKPEPAVFERLLQRYGVAPARALYVDDDEAYVAGASRVGMQAIHYRTPQELARQLRERGLSI